MIKKFLDLGLQPLANKYLRKKFANYRFIKLQKGLKKYFQWIDKLPKNKKLYNYHPLKLAQK